MGQNDNLERAAQVWAVLALTARNSQILTYDIIGKLIGVPQYALGRMLEPIQSYCLVNHLPPLSILVVSERTDISGTGFIAAQDIPRTQVEVFGFDWLAHTSPLPEVLEQAVKQLPSSGVSTALTSKP